MNTRLTKYLVGVSEAKAPKSFSIKLLVESNKPPAKQLTPDDAARVKNLPVGMWQRGGKVYTAAVGGEYLGQVVGNIYVPKKQADVAASSDTPSSAQDTDAQDASSRPTDAATPTLPLFKLIKSKRAMLSGLIDAILANDPQEIQKQISALELVRDSEGRLKSTRKGIEYSFFGKDAERATLALKELEALLGPLDISIPTERERTMSDASADSLKPQSIKSGTKKATPKILRGDSGSPRGFALGDAEYTVIKQSPNLKKQLIESQPYVSETFQRMGMSPEEATAEAEAVNDSIAAHNLKIRFLAQEIESNPEAFTEVTDRSALANTLSDKIAEAAGGNLLPRQKQAIVGILRQLAEADTTEEFDKAWAQQSTEPSVTGDEQFLLNLLLEANLPPNVIPALCESVEVLRKSVGDTKVLIPTRQNFPIADIIALRTPMSSLDSIQDAESLSEDIAKQLQLVYVQVDLVSIKSGAKKGAGRAAASQTRILLTEFDSEPTRRDLLSLVGSPAHSELWNCKDANEFAYYSNEKLSILLNYISDIIAYYELETAVESAGNDPRKQLELVFQILGRGTAPRYDNNGMYVGPGAISKMFSEESNITELNRLQLRLYSFIGFASDAIYSQRAKQQGFTNVAYTASGIKETDGVGLMARSVFQFSRNPEEWKNTSGMVVYRPSYSYTSNLEYTDSTDALKTFTARKTKTGTSQTNELLEATREPATGTEKNKEKKDTSAVYSIGGKWYTADPEKGGKYVGRYDGDKWIKATPDEKKKEKEKKRFSVQAPASQDATGNGNDATQVPKPITVGPRVARPSSTRVGHKDSQSKTRVRSFVDIINQGNPEDISRFIEDNNILYDAERDTFYFGMANELNREGGVKLSGDFRTPFLPKAKSKVGTYGEQREYQKSILLALESMGISVPRRRKVKSNFSPSAIVSKNQIKILKSSNQTGSVSIAGVEYENPTEQTDPREYIGQEIKKWITNNPNHNSEELQKVTESITLLMLARGERYKALRSLEGKEIAEYRGDEGIASYSTDLESTVNQLLTDSESQSTFGEILNKMRSSTSPEERTEQLLVLSAFLEEHPDTGRAYAYLAESLSILMELAEGRTVVIPIDPSFASVDLISLGTTGKEVPPSEMTGEELEEQIQLIQTGVSVKRNAGAASSSFHKSTLAIYKNHIQTRKDIEVLTGEGALTGCFSEDTSEIYDTLTRNLDDIKSYWNLPDEISTTEQLIEFFQYGRPECIRGKTRPRKKEYRPAPQKARNINQAGYALFNTMSFAFEALHNSRLRVDPTTHHSWSGASGVKSGRARVVAVLNKGTTNKGKRNQKPVGFTSANVVVSKDTNIADGNPCTSK